MSLPAPYYNHAGITIYHGDCLEIMPHLEKVDLVLTDPPYDEYTHRGALTGTDGFGMSYKPLSNPESMIKLFLNISTKWILIFSSLEMLGMYQNIKSQNYIRGGVWDRIVNTPQFSGDRPAQGAEGIAIFHSVGKNMKWQGGGKAAIWREMVERGKKLHENQKPLNLIKKLVNLFSLEDETIIDSFMGSGTTLVAAKELGRRAIGIEIEEKYCEIAVIRLAQEIFDY